jgi:hypothetical protein
MTEEWMPVETARDLLEAPEFWARVRSRLRNKGEDE